MNAKKAKSLRQIMRSFDVPPNEHGFVVKRHPATLTRRHDSFQFLLEDNCGHRVYRHMKREIKHGRIPDLVGALAQRTSARAAAEPADAINVTRP